MFTLNCRGKLLELNQPVVMGIINTTPDSFFEGSRQQSISAALEQAGRMIEEGAAILDIGGQSTRPNAEMIGAAAETERVVPVIEAIHQKFSEVIISVDTFYAEVAEAAAHAGAAIINDVSASSVDERILDIAASYKMPYICMHSNGIPAGKNPAVAYDDVMQTLLDFFIQKIDQCRRAGINDVVIDPGFGFGKTVEDNFRIVKKLSLLRMLEKPILLGVSRKSGIYKTLGIAAEEALNGTTVLHTIGIQQGAQILRVHDVKEAKEVVKLLEVFNEL